MPVTSEQRHGSSSDLLRLATAGSVDDGKSTLIGRLLHDAKAILADQLDDLRGRDGELDLSRLTDGLRAEREQGITIDVAYRYFATAKRTFILADTPGHVQYTRNMVTGASTADLAIVLVDARTRRGRADAPPRVHRVAARHPPPRRRGQQDGPRRLLRGGLRRGRARLLRLPLAARGARHRLRADQRAARRQRRRALRGDAVVRRPGAARAPRDASRSRPTATCPSCASPCSTSSATARATTAATRGRWPAACCAPATRCSCSPPSASRTVASIDTLDGSARRGLPADERHRPPGRRARRLARGPHLRPRRPPGPRPRPDGRRVLDGRRAAARRRALRDQARHAHGARDRGGARGPRRARAPWAASRRLPSWPSTTSAACACAPPSRSRSTPTRATAPPARSSSSTRRRTTPSARA